MNDQNWNSKLELELSDLLEALADENASPVQVERISALVSEYPEALAVYRKSAELNALMFQLADEQLAPGTTNSVIAPLPTQSSGFFPQSFPVMLFAFSALLIGCAAFWFFGSGSESNSAVAKISNDDTAIWAIPVPTDQDLKQGIYKISSGELSLDFDSGASVVVTGPAEFELEFPETLKLLRGQLKTDVPESAIGFTVHVPNAAYVDMGTRAAISVFEDGTSNVQVEQGLVRVSVRRLDGEEVVAETVPAGHGRAVDLSGVISTTQSRVHRLSAGQEHLVIQAESAVVSRGLNQAFVPHRSANATGGERLNSLIAGNKDVTGIPQQTNFSVHDDETVSYRVQFETPGRYYWHLRYMAPGPNSNSIFGAFDGEVFEFDNSPAENLRTPTSGDQMEWVTFGVIEVTDTLEHSFILAPREAGLVIDTIVLSKKPSADGQTHQLLETLVNAE